MHEARRCLSCDGTGERPTDFGPVDCPDCGGSGILPSRSVHTDWRARDIDRAMSTGQLPQKADVKWLLTELQASRQALTEIIALAHDVTSPDAISLRIRSVASAALGLYDMAPARDE